MRYYSTNKTVEEVDFKTAIFKGLPDDNGLFFPEHIAALPTSFWENIEKFSFQEVAFQIAQGFIGSEIPEAELKEIINQAIDFDAPAVKLKANLYCLELFHGPSMAFKDFGARFMAATMSYFLQKENQVLNILVATSGDTGGAVAQGFYKKPNINVQILYPTGKVSEIQEKQLTTLGENIRAFEVKGTFDDCQKLVKEAFLDNTINKKLNLASANSINIARLIPQAFYYAWTYRQLKSLGKEIVIAVPSGNFGNLTAGLFAQKLGMPIKAFVAATNVNKVVPEFLLSGEYKAISPSISTISNAMDVGNPSNFPRITELFEHDLEKMRETIKGFYFTDRETKEAVSEIYEKFDYLACPHTAVAYLGLKSYDLKENEVGVFFSTAHYAKFLPEMQSIIKSDLPIPERLGNLLDLKKESIVIEADFEEFKGYLLSGS